MDCRCDYWNWSYQQCKAKQTVQNCITISIRTTYL